MSDATPDLEAYLARIGFDGPLLPTRDSLTRLIERHAASIPFENIDVLVGRVPSLELDALQRKLVGGKRGGYCFEQNHLLMACLQHSGFAVRRLEARVRAGVPAEVLTGRTHMALRVTLDGVDHLVDVGFGGLAPLAPLVLDTPAEQHAGSGVYRFVELEGERLLQHRTPDGWGDCYRVLAAEPHPIDHEIGNWYVATHPKAMLRHNLLAGRAVDGGRLTLFNHELALRRPETGTPETTRLHARAEFADVLADAFGLQIDAADLDALMRLLDRKLDA